MSALEPVTCTRCGVSIAADDPARPESVRSSVFAPANPRPGGGKVWWEVEADYREGGRITALLCPSCIAVLTDWIYTAPSGH